MLAIFLEFLFYSTIFYIVGIQKVGESGPDGGNDSGVTGYWLFESKNICSIAFLHFEKGTRENYHSHAFNAVTWFLWGEVEEQHLDGTIIRWKGSLWPKFTSRSTFHRVNAVRDTWALTFRGPWQKEWEEYNPTSKEFTTLTHGRIVIA